MIFGDIDEFAVLIEPIPKWNTEYLKEGLFEVFVAGVRINSEIVCSTLTIQTRTMFFSVQETPKDPFPCKSLPVGLSGRSSAVVYLELMRICYPTNADETDYQEFEYTITPFALGDYKRCIFWYLDGDHEVLLAGGMELSAEISLPRGLCANTLRAAHEYAEKLSNTHL